jgi:large subunit ribosomal protein L6
MSKIGKQPVQFDKATVTVTAEKGGEFSHQLIKVKGPKGEIELSVKQGVKVEVTDGVVTVTRKNDMTQNKALHGLYRSLIANMVAGVVTGFEKKLEIHGVGYRGNQTGNSIELSLGFSHTVKFDAPEGITLTMADQNTILISGVDKQKVGEVAATIRGIRKPEPYKGKGIRYSGEKVRRKAGKANITAA